MSLANCSLTVTTLLGQPFYFMVQQKAQGMATFQNLGERIHHGRKAGM